ncbi:MAG: hypothetical protein QOJ65_2134 [Fimbriimonadaceae bacterium]|nr:hypothetical protein [Fimbriimonadaceae bacterium]
MLRAVSFASATLFALLTAFSAAQSDQPPAESRDWNYYDNFQYSKQLLSKEDLLNIPVLDDADEKGSPKYVRGIIFGRHGRIFRDTGIQGYLTGADWYKANPKFSNSMLNEKERANLDLVREREAELHGELMPGDLRFWRDKAIPAKRLAGSSLVELHIMRAEIEAVHGKRFDDEPLLQKYFEERYWYKPAKHYDPKTLSEIERKNMDLLSKAETTKRGTGLAPGSLLAYGEKPIPPSLLKGLNLHELRLLRNEIYAIRGGRFRTAWIQQHFDEEDWYSPLPEGNQPPLTALDQRNVAVILRRENQLHQGLSSAKLTSKDLDGMFADDATRLKNEIYARRGRVFKSKWLQGYFASMAWYKANPGYSDKLLTPIERQNIATIAKYERKQIAEERLTEG